MSLELKRLIKIAPYGLLSTVVTIVGTAIVNSQMKRLDQYLKDRSNLSDSQKPSPNLKNSPVYLQNRDIDGDGALETLLVITPPNGASETRLVEIEDGRLKIRRYEIIEGILRYLPE